MVNFVIYEKDNGLRETYVKVIKKFLYNASEHFKIYRFDEFNLEVQEKIDKIVGAKIYLLNIDSTDPNVLEIARKLREDGDFMSPIILLTQKDKYSFLDELGNILYLDLLRIDERIIFRLMTSLKNAYKIVTRYAVYSFSIFDEIYRVSYDNIYYIQKNLNDDSVTIYTKDDSYLHYITIKGIEEVLSRDPRFLKVHRSCILNIYNVSSYDRKSNIVVFNNGMTTTLVSKYKKAQLVERLKDFNNDDKNDE